MTDVVKDLREAATLIQRERRQIRHVLKLGAKVRSVGFHRTTGGKEVVLVPVDHYEKFRYALNDLGFCR